MAFTKYIIEFVDNFGRNVLIRLSQKEETAPKVVYPGKNPISISWTGDDGDAFKSIWSSKATISLFLPEDNIELFEDIANLKEDQFGVNITISEPGQPDYVWDGWLVPDEQTRNFSYYNQEIKLLAIDPIEKLKGRKLINLDKTFLNGKYSFIDILSVCFEGVYNPDNTLNTYEFEVISTLKMDFGVSFTENILEQLQVDAETFNDDSGRPINCFEVVEVICDALFMRCFYEDGKIYFIDKFQYYKASQLGDITLYFNESNPSGAYPAMLVKNTENITGIRVFRESIASFKYKGFTGLLLDGYFSNWEEIGSGSFKLASWDYNSVLSSQPDVYQRRKGTGRQESPYGILLRAYNDHTIVPPPFPLASDAIGGHTEVRLTTADLLKLSIVLEIVDISDIGYLGGNTFSASIPYAVIIYNESDPTNSFRLSASADNTLIWQSFNASGTSFASGVNDFAFFFSLGGPQWAQPGLSLEPTVSRQIVEAEFPPVPENVLGQAFVMIGPIRGVSKSVPGGAIDANCSQVIYSQCLLTKIPSTDPLLRRTGEIVYLTRDISASKDNYSKEVGINTTSRFGVAGCLYSNLNYIGTGGVVVNKGDLVTRISSSDNSLYALIDLYLISYVAMMRIWFNTTQYQIDFEALAKGGGFRERIDFSCVYDPDRPSTSIYNEAFIQTSHTWDLKTGDRKITAISMKVDARSASTGMLDEHQDLIEYYYQT